ncbi:22034_t:CDS:2 [Gigaspora margarita]|uniref:22034_t:CDS:1 n=1 Tax=Gigaspora margarita TaxID=4874 RepID=A0ABM8W6L4_GIGMA|nr:22034_t:CDS:2 [Gigaspora margarita]
MTMKKKKGFGVALAIDNCNLFTFNDKKEREDVKKEIINMYNKWNKQTHIVILRDFNCIYNKS